MKVVVTGGAGFIGSNIVDTYLAAGHRVVVIDNLHHGFRRNLNALATFYKADICDLSEMRRIMRRERPQVINHHAAIAEVVASVHNPIPTMTVNVQGTMNVLQTGGEVRIKKFIFASTGGAIYGNAKKLPTPESAACLPESPYGLSKLLAEECIAYYSRQYGFQSVIFRYPNVYGPRQDPKGEAGVVAIFSALLAQHQPATIFGDGQKTRDYVYVKDIARANRIALTKGKNVMMNLGWGKEISDQQVFETIHRHFSGSPRARFKPVRPGEVVRSCLNARLAVRLLGWKPHWSFPAGINDYLRMMQYV